MNDPGPVFAALADPTRRRVLDLVAAGDGVTATELAAELPITRQAVAKHLAALARAGLVEQRREGRETLFRLAPEPLTEAMAWLASTGARWDSRLRELERYVASRGAAAR